VTPPSARQLAELVERGHAALERGDAAAAVPPLREAAAIGRQLLEAAPEDQQRAYALGRALYALGNALTVTPDLPAAVAALDEALTCYRPLPGPAGRALVADVRLRRARAHALLGAGASAVVDAQAAIVGYVRISTAERLDEHYLGFARVAMRASDVLAAYGDPEVALAAAQEGVSWAVRAVNSGAVARDGALTGAMVQALSVEIALLERLGRGSETANAAGALAFLGAPRVRVLLDERGVPGLSPDDGGVEAAVRMAGLLAPDPRGTLADLLLRHPVGPVITPAFRTGPERLVPAAEAAAGAATALLANDVTAGMRLGLEAHYLFAFVHDEVLDQRFPDPRTEASVLTWCRLLADLATRAEAGGDDALARDLAGWGVLAFLLLDPFDDSPARVAALAGPTSTFDRLGVL
jgi:hypothetical protein